MSTHSNRLRRAIFASCRQRGIDTALRHEIQLGATGKESLTQMTDDDLRKVLDAVNGRARPRRSSGGKAAETGRHPAGPNTRSLPDGPHTSKLRALWISAWWLGVVDDASDEALGAWIRRQTGLDAARWATPAQTAACIEALKGWMERDGGVDWSATVVGTRKAHRPAARIMEALWRRLFRAGAVEDAGGAALSCWVIGFRRSDEHYAALPVKVQNQLVQQLGRWLKQVEGRKDG